MRIQDFVALQVKKHFALSDSFVAHPYPEATPITG